MSDMAEVKRLIEAQGETWNEYKKANDERIAKLATGESVADLDAKLAKMDAKFKEIDETAKQALIKAQRPGAGGQKAAEEVEVEVKGFNAGLKSHAQRLGRPQPADVSADNYASYKAGFRAYLRKGKEDLSDEERKAINVGTDPQGGYLVDEEMDAAIDRVATKASAIRSLSRVQTIGSAKFEKIVKTSGASAGGWGNEQTAPSETNTQGWVELEFVPGLNWAEPRATATSLEDSVINVEADLIEELGITFADQESQAFVDGSGVNRPKGILAYTMVANASYSWGSVGYTASGGASDFASSNPSDKLIDLVHSLKRSYRAGASFLMNDLTLAAIRKFKDGQGNYLWAPSQLMGGAVGQLLGFPVATDDYMPDVGANAYPIAFADFRRAYLIVDRRGMVILRDPYTAKPYVKFWTTRRVGGGIQNFEAIKVMKIATS